MLCVKSEVLDDTVTFEKKTRLIFSFYICLRLTSPNDAIMRCRLYSNQKVQLYVQLMHSFEVNTRICQQILLKYIWLFT